MSPGIQIVSFGVILSIWFNYLLNDRLPVTSTIYFSRFLFMALLNILTEFVTIYTIQNINVVGTEVNRLCHQFFIGSLDLMIFSLFLYIDTKIRGREKYTVPQLIARVLPVVISIFVVIFGRLDYYVSANGFYSYGPVAYTIYCCIGFYITWISVSLIRSKNCFSLEDKVSIFFGIGLWILMCIYQFLIPVSLISSMGIAIMALFIHMTFENQRVYSEAGMHKIMNRRAFELMINDYVDHRKEFSVLSYVLSDSRLYQDSIRHSELPKVMEALCDSLINDRHIRVYRPKSNTMSVIVTEESTKKKLLDAYREDFEYTTSGDGSKVAIKYFLSVLDYPGITDTAEGIMEITDFMADNAKTESTEGIIIIDSSIVNRKDYYASVERIVQNALKNDGLDVHYQPIYNTETGHFNSSEALVRLKDTETLGYISPEVFIPIAEERGMIRKLGSIVFEKVCAFARDNRLNEKGVDYIEVNLSGVQSTDSELPGLLYSCMKKYGISPEFINLEITETASIKAGNSLEKNMDTLRKMGCKFSMDDFGTGYSNLSKIADTNFELIKLDKSLLWPCFEENNGKALILLNSCIDMIKNLGIGMVAEGVETEAQAKLLTDKGVQHLQGYYYSKPLTEEKYLEFMANG